MCVHHPKYVRPPILTNPHHPHYHQSSSSLPSSQVLDNAWRGAAAYHYFLLAQRQLYGQKVDDAMKTAIRLAEYEDILEPRVIYCLVALTAYHNSYFGICSKAFVKLETMPSLNEEQRDQVWLVV